jgi:hypothetical protein
MTIYRAVICWMGLWCLFLTGSPGALAHDWNGIAMDRAGNLYVVDAEDGQIWKVSPAGKAEVYRKGAARGQECVPCR